MLSIWLDAIKHTFSEDRSHMLAPLCQKPWSTACLVKCPISRLAFPLGPASPEPRGHAVLGGRLRKCFHVFKTRSIKMNFQVKENVLICINIFIFLPLGSHNVWFWYFCVENGVQTAQVSSPMKITCPFQVWISFQATAKRIPIPTTPHP